MNASVHRCLDQWPNVFVFDSTLSGNFVKSTAVSTVTHRLVLEIALSTLVTNRAIKRVVGEEEFHNALPGFMC
jgi:hypothetical protein